MVEYFDDYEGCPTSATDEGGRFVLWFWYLWVRGIGDIFFKKLPDQLQIVFTLMVGEQAEMSDAMEPARRGMNQETADELIG